MVDSGGGISPAWLISLSVCLHCNANAILLSCRRLELWLGFSGGSRVLDSGTCRDFYSFCCRGKGATFRVRSY